MIPVRPCADRARGHIFEKRILKHIHTVVNECERAPYGRNCFPIEKAKVTRSITNVHVREPRDDGKHTEQQTLCAWAHP